MMMSYLRRLMPGGFLLAALAQAAVAAPAPGVLDRPAPMVARPEARVLLDLASSGARTVAVGERGLIVLSEDGGKVWRQVPAPVSVSLTAIAFAGPRVGWAVGHGATVLRTDDGGHTWRKQLDGRQVIRILNEAGAREGEAMQKVARQFEADGADKPLLAIYAADAMRLTVVGAYGLALASDDGGASWRSLMGGLNNPRGLHLYAIASVDKVVWVAGEQGFLAKSGNGGKTFSTLTPPYEGSFFSIAPLADGEVLVSGLKGNAFRSAGDGARFDRVSGFAPISLSASRSGDANRVFFVNQAGQAYASSDGGRSVRMLSLPHAIGPLSAVLPMADGTLLATGVRGISRIAVSATPTIEQPAK